MVGYFDDDMYPIVVSTHNRLLKGIPKIAVDGARLYVLTCSEGIKGLNHSLGNIKEGERHLIEFNGPRWFNHCQCSSSRGGRYVTFSHLHMTCINHEWQLNCSTKWLTQSSELERRRFKRIMFTGEDSDSSALSRDGQTLCNYKYGRNPITRVYQVRKENPFALTKLKLNGMAYAVSGKGNRFMAAKPRQLEIHEIDKDTSNLVWVCQINATDCIRLCIK